MARSSGTRKGNGAGRGGPAKGAGKGDGWGGPAQGEGSKECVSAFQHMSNDEIIRANAEARRAMLKDNLLLLALRAERQETQVSATVAYLNRDEGMPTQKQEIEARVASHVIRAPAKAAGVVDWLAEHAPRVDE